MHLFNVSRVLVIFTNSGESECPQKDVHYSLDVHNSIIHGIYSLATGQVLISKRMTKLVCLGNGNVSVHVYTHPILYMNIDEFQLC